MKHSDIPRSRIVVISGALFCAALLVSARGMEASSRMADAPAAGIQQVQGADAAPFWAEHGRVTFGFQFGYALENSIPRDISHINMVIAEPQVGIIAWDSPHSRLPVKRFEIITEGILGSAYRPGGSLLGTSLLLRLGLKPDGRVAPFVDMGSGPLHTTLNKNAAEITGHTQFLSQGGMGFQYFFKPQQALVFAYRYFHMSNGGLQEPNPGFNGSMLTIGFCWQRQPHILLAAKAPHALLRFLHVP